ncbi:MAG: hypothetical protein JWO69_1133 [Thermoleophilia bacterium]|jgi:tRNA U34 5-methylaminomethyl-2-thiouridine-forming methyltransferase MnmC|nr:hypothetical protein [Thermoleophilia bacterium]
MDDRDQPFKRFLDRAAPRLRDLDAAISSNEELRAARDRIASRVADATKHAVDAIRGTEADDADIVDGEVLEERATRAPVATSADAAHAAATGPTAPAAPHWNRARVARMVAAAGREAVRPTPSHSSTRRVVIAVGALLATVGAWRLLRRR